jgi:hypothetical protein
MIKFKPLLHIGIGTIILSIIGLYNGYPLVYSDTGTYIYSGFGKFIPNDRPITYGLFLWFFSFNYSAWFVILMQNFLTAFVLYQTLKLFKFKESFLVRFYFYVIMFLVIFTGIGWYSNQLMPDFFAPLVALIIFAILVGEGEITLFSKSILILVLVYSLITHFSHLLIGTVIILIAIFFKVVLKQKMKRISFKRISLAVAILISGWLLLPGINYLVEKKFILSKGSHVFIMAHLADGGILKKFLKENCSKPEFQDCKLCAYKDALPTDLASFIWSSNNILENTGGWLESKEEYNKIIMGTLKDPKYLLLNTYRSLTYGFVQLTKNEIGQGLSAYIEGSAPYGQIHWRFHDELNNYMNSRQNKWSGVNLNLNILNTVHLVLIMVSLFILILLFTNQLLISKIDPLTLNFLIFVIIAIIVNSFITAGLNSPCERFQARVIWLLPLAEIILVVKNFSVIKAIIVPELDKPKQET